jgi:Cu2+-containing amine oxidase
METSHEITTVKKGFTNEPVTSKILHPLDILTEVEIKLSVELIRGFFKNEPSLRFCRLFLKEPTKEYIANYEAALQKVHSGEKARNPLLYEVERSIRKRCFIANYREIWFMMEILFRSSLESATVFL